MEGIVKELPYTGLFANKRWEGGWKHNVPSVRPPIELNDMANDLFGEPIKPFKSCAVEALRRVASGDGTPESDARESRDWLEFEAMIEPVEFRCDHPGWGTVIYRITEKGMEFLAQHEAPECWA